MGTANLNSQSWLQKKKVITKDIHESRLAYHAEILKCFIPDSESLSDSQLQMPLAFGHI